MDEQILRDNSPYHFQRQRQVYSKRPRPPQAAIQPNRKSRQGWGGTTRDYWGKVMDDYLKRGGI